MSLGTERPVGRACPLAEELDSGAVRVERRNAMDTFVAHPHCLPAGGQDLQPCAASHQVVHEGADLGD